MRLLTLIALPPKHTMAGAPLALIFLPLAAIALSGCAGFSIPGTTGNDPTALLHEINTNLAGCDRQIQGTTGPIPTASFNITCRAQATIVVAPPAAPAPAPAAGAADLAPKPAA